MARAIRFDHPLPLDRLPSSRLRRRRAPALGFALAAALSLCVALALLGVRGEAALQLVDRLILGVLGGVTIGLLLRAVSLWTEREMLVLDGLNVTTRIENCLGSREWSEALSGYRGVLTRERIVRRAPGTARPTIVREVRLVHANENRSVDLFASKDGRATDSYHDQACRTLRMPTLTAGVDGLMTSNRDHVDHASAPAIGSTPLTKSLGLEGIPRELRIDSATDGFGVTLDRCEMRWYSFPIIVGFPFGLHWVCTRAPMPPAMAWIVLAVTVLVAVFTVGVFTLDRIGRRRLELHGDHLDYFLRTPFGDLMHNRIDVQDLSSASIRRDPRGRPELAIDARERQVEIGTGLSWESLEWLRAVLVQNVRAETALEPGAAGPQAASTTTGG